MAKIMLVEDDDNLREIYGARLIAEGHEIVSAKDGEEALALAVKEKPELIISDVMMPRISGFDMLDILRNAPETKNTKVIMMTALSQAEDKSRADNLGADRYLVKSQVTLEDVTNVVREVLGGEASVQQTDEQAPAPVETTSAPTASTENTPVVSSDPSPVAVNEPAPEQTPEPESSGTQQAAEAHDMPAEPALPPADTSPADSAQSAPSDEVAPQPQTPPVEESSIPAPPTVDSIANPDIEVAGDNETGEVQPPPSEAPTDDSGLPPIVEPGASDESTIKVELPKLPGDNPTEETGETPASDEAKTAPPQPEENPTPLGPSLIEALEAEQKQADEPIPSPASRPIIVQTEEAESNPVEPQIIASPLPDDHVQPSNDTVVVTPDPEAVAAAQAKAEQEAAALQTSDSPPNTLAKKVIQPINDPNAKPDINELLEAEERRAAVDNPVANTVITPGPVASDGDSDPKPAPAQAPHNDLNNIAL